MSHCDYECIIKILFGYQFYVLKVGRFVFWGMWVILEDLDKTTERFKASFGWKILQSKLALTLKSKLDSFYTQSLLSIKNDDSITNLLSKPLNKVWFVFRSNTTWSKLWKTGYTKPWKCNFPLSRVSVYLYKNIFLIKYHYFYIPFYDLYHEFLCFWQS